MKKNILVLGAGLSGLATAVHLTDEGHAVTILEKRPFAGGRTYSFYRDFWPHPIDNGAHLLLGCYNETLALLQKIGSASLLQPQNRLTVPFYLSNHGSACLRVAKLPPPVHLLVALLRFPLLHRRQKLALVRLFWQFSRLQERAELDMVTAAVWLREQGQDQESMNFFWRPLIVAALNSQPEEVSLLQLVRVLKLGFLRGKLESRLILLPAGLTPTLIDPLINWLKRHGCQIQYRCTIKQLLVADDRMRKVVTNTGDYENFDWMISALSFIELRQVLQHSQLLAGSPLAAIAEMSGSAIFNLHFWIERRLIVEPMATLPGRTAQWLFVNQTHGGLTHHTVVTSGGNHWLGLPKSEMIQALWTDLKQVFPDFQPGQISHHYLTVEKNATLLCKPGTEAQRPMAGPFYQNLILVGDWTRTGLPPTLESAARSGRQAAQLILAQQNLMN